MTNSYMDKSFFMSHILPVYKRATVWDENVCLAIQGSITYSYAKAVDRTKTYIVGSGADGAVSPRLYKTPPVLETDQLFLFIDSGGGYGQPNHDKVGVYVDNDTSRQEHWDTIVTLAPSCVHSPSPGSPEHVLKAHLKAQDILDRNPQFYPKCYKNYEFSDSNKGPSMIHSFIRYNTHIQGDQVMAWHHQDWPKEAEEWRTRARLWPPASVVEQALQQGYQVVVKHSSSTGGIDGHVEWCISFTLCERYLARQRTPVQKLVYLMAKTLFYSYLDLHDDDNPSIDFPSYALKTSMMWLMEQTPLDMWTENNVPSLLRELLTHLKVGACDGTLKNYFMIGANILSNCTSNLLEKVERQINQILCDMNKCLQETELYKCNLLLYGYHIWNGGKKAYYEVVYNCQSIAMGYGLLRVIEEINKVRATYQRIIEILEQGTGEALQAKGYLFDEEECFHILKVMMNVHSANYMKNGRIGELYNTVCTILSRNPLTLSGLIKDVLCLDQHLPEPEVTITKLRVEWQDRRSVRIQHTVSCGYRSEEVLAELQHTNLKHKLLLILIRHFPGETDVILVREGPNIDVYKWTSIGELIESYVRELQDREIDKWMPKLFSLTHLYIPEAQLMDFARMLYLLYVCDKSVPI